MVTADASPLDPRAAATQDSPIESDETPYVRQARARVGTVVRGKWRLESLLGVGGMGAVYEAKHRNGSRAALKILLPLHGADRVTVQRFLREGYVASELRHPGAVTIYDDDFTEDGLPFLVMEFLDGRSLGARLQDGRLSVTDCVAIGTAVLDVLSRAHERGIVHRDIKPDNVFLVEGGSAKLLDFGIARLRTLGTGERATVTGAMLGTPAFMPPEQARGRWDEVDARSDVWAVGATLYVALSGVPVRDARTINETLLLAMTAPVRSLALVAPDVPRSIVEVIDRAVAFDTETRFPDAASMRDALARAYELRDVQPPTLGRWRTRGRIAAAGMLIVALAAAGVIALPRSAPLPAVSVAARAEPPPTTAADVPQPADPSPPIEPALDVAPASRLAAPAPAAPPRARPKPSARGASSTDPLALPPSSAAPSEDALRRRR